MRAKDLAERGAADGAADGDVRPAGSLAEAEEMAHRVCFLCTGGSVRRGPQGLVCARAAEGMPLSGECGVPGLIRDVARGVAPASDVTVRKLEASVPPRDDEGRRENGEESPSTALP